MNEMLLLPQQAGRHTERASQEGKECISFMLCSKKATTDAASQHRRPVYIQQGFWRCRGLFRELGLYTTAAFHLHASAVGKLPFYVYHMLHKN